MAGGTAAQFIDAWRVVEQCGELLRPRRRVVAVDEDAAVSDGRRQPTDRRGHDGRAGGGRLDRDEPERLAVRRHRDDIRRMEPGDEFAPRDGRHEVDDVLDAQLARERLQREGLVEA